MLSIALAAVIAYGWYEYVEKKPASALCAICAVAILFNVPLQDVAPGPAGMGIALVAALVLINVLLILGGTFK